MSAREKKRVPEDDAIGIGITTGFGVNSGGSGSPSFTTWIAKPKLR